MIRGSFQLKAVLGVMALGFGFSIVFGADGARQAAATGVLLAGLTSLFALWLKGWAVQKNLEATLMTVGIVFGLRLVTACALVGVSNRFGHGIAATVGFFGAFFPLLLIEMSYVLSARKALSARSAT